MNDSPDVSVVMGVYNGAEHLRETIDSVLAQEGVAFELVLVNDGSTDQSGEILNKYQNQESRIKVIHQKNQGLTRALITGCAVASGKYIARHDVGDVSHSHRLALQKRALDNESKLAFVSCWTEFCGPEWEHLYIVKGTGVASYPTHIISQKEEFGIADGPTHHGSVMVRKHCYGTVGGYRPHFYFAQDFDLWYRLAEIGKFQIVAEPLYQVRVTPGSISTSHKGEQETLGRLALTAMKARQGQLSEQHILEEAIKIRPRGKRGRFARDSARANYFVGECLRQNGNVRSLIYFRKSIAADPFFLKAWVKLLYSVCTAPSPRNERRIPGAHDRWRS